VGTGFISCGIGVHMRNIEDQPGPYQEIFFYIEIFLTPKPPIMLNPFFVWQDKVLKRIDPEMVMCLETQGNYTKIFLSDHTFYMVRSTLSGALKKLPPELFIRIHRSLAVNIYFIDDIAKDQLIIGGESIPIGKQYYKTSIRKLNIIE
jgi:hypothetical protein